MRQSLLDKGLLQERELLVSDLPNYKQISLFNAMMELGEVVLPVNKIIG
jgi:4-amino-4-deoxychorismate lyase